MQRVFGRSPQSESRLDATNNVSATGSASGMFNAAQATPAVKVVFSLPLAKPRAASLI